MSYYSHGCTPDIRRASDGHTALLVAAEAGHLQGCRVLLEKGVDPRITETTVERCILLDSLCCVVVQQIVLHSDVSPSTAVLHWT